MNPVKVFVSSNLKATHFKKFSNSSPKPGKSATLELIGKD